MRATGVTMSRCWMVMTLLAFGCGDDGTGGRGDSSLGSPDADVEDSGVEAGVDAAVDIDEGLAGQGDCPATGASWLVDGATIRCTVGGVCVVWQDRESCTWSCGDEVGDSRPAFTGAATETILRRCREEG